MEGHISREIEGAGGFARASGVGLWSRLFDYCHCGPAKLFIGELSISYRMIGLA